MLGESFTIMDKTNINKPEGKSSFKCQPFKCHLPMELVRICFLPSVAITFSTYFFVRTRTLFYGLGNFCDVKVRRWSKINRISRMQQNIRFLHLKDPPKVFYVRTKGRGCAIQLTMVTDDCARIDHQARLYGCQSYKQQVATSCKFPTPCS